MCVGSRAAHTHALENPVFQTLLCPFHARGRQGTHLCKGHQSRESVNDGGGPVNLDPDRLPGVTFHRIPRESPCCNSSRGGQGTAPDTNRGDDIRSISIYYPLGSCAIVTHPPFLSPSKIWPLLTIRDESLGHGLRVQTFMEWLQACTVELAWTLKSLTIVDLADTTLLQRQEIMERLVPRPAPPPILVYQTGVQYLLQPQVNHPPPPTHKSVGTAKRWGNYMRSLLCLCNVTNEGDLTAI